MWVFLSGNSVAFLLMMVFLLSAGEGLIVLVPLCALLYAVVYFLPLAVVWCWDKFRNRKWRS